ncbi:MAG: hypothetical protein MZV70_44655, partial [Desulfobacterales bacterium]|nr:hypothetical protein [Desulfobacterales bacterium]
LRNIAKVNTKTPTTFFSTSTGMGSDEDLIWRDMEGRGLKVKYEPSAMIPNRGPTNVEDFFEQRTRVNIGERVHEALVRL